MVGARKRRYRIARQAALVGFVAILLVGCRGSGQSTEPVDPFFGRVRIDPPRTGTIGNPVADPSYAPVLRPNPLRGSPTGGPANPLLPGPTSSRPTGWMPAGTGGTPGISTGSARQGNLALGTAAASNLAPGSVPGLSASQTMPNPTAGPGTQSQPAELSGAGATAGDRIVIPPAARDLDPSAPLSPFGQSQRAFEQPQPGLAQFPAGLGHPPAGSLQSRSGLAQSQAGVAPALGPGASFPSSGGNLEPPGAAAPSVSVSSAALHGRGLPGRPSPLSPGTATPPAGAPTMSRPTVNLAAERERIIRTLNPAGPLGSSRLPQPVDPRLPQPVDPAATASPPGLSGISRVSGPGDTQSAGGGGTVPAGAMATGTAPSSGIRFPSRLVDITELPAAPTAK